MELFLAPDLSLPRTSQHPWRCTLACNTSTSDSSLSPLFFSLATSAPFLINQGVPSTRKQRTQILMPRGTADHEVGEAGQMCADREWWDVDPMSPVQRACCYSVPLRCHWAQCGQISQVFKRNIKFEFLQETSQLLKHRAG